MFQVDMATLEVGCRFMAEGDLGVVVEVATKIAPAGANGLAIYTSPSTFYLVNKVTGRRLFQDGFDVVKITSEKDAKIADAISFALQSVRAELRETVDTEERDELNKEYSRLEALMGDYAW